MRPLERAIGFAAELSIPAIAINAFAVLIALMSFMGFSPRLVAVAGLAGSAMFVLFRSRSLRNAFRSSAGVASYTVSRMLLLLTPLIAEGTGVGQIHLTSTTILAIVIVGETLVRSLTDLAYPYAANLPNVIDRNLGRFGYGWITLVGIGAIAVGFLGLLYPLFYSLQMVMALAALAITVAAVYDSYKRVQARRSFEAILPDVLAAEKPVFLVHWHAPTGNSYQLSMWLPYLERLNLPYAIIVRTTGNFRDLTNMTDRPLILRKRLEELDDIIVPSVRAVVYVNSAARNGHLVRFPHLKHIQLNHGESDKATSYSPVFRMYDYNFVAGQAAVDRFALHGVAMRSSMFRIVGRPQVEAVAVKPRPGPTPGTHSRASDNFDNVGNNQRVRVLYAPTWSGFYEDTNYSSLPFAEEILRELIRRDCEVIYRPHPYTHYSSEMQRQSERIRNLLHADSQRSTRAHIYGARSEKQMTLFECFNAADAMISDVSSVVGDFLHSEKPYALVAVVEEERPFEEVYPTAAGGYVLKVESGALTNLNTTLDLLLITDPKDAERAALKKYYLGDFSEVDYTDVFLNTFRAVLANEEEGVSVEETAVPLYGSPSK